MTTMLRTTRLQPLALGGRRRPRPRSRSNRNRNHRSHSDKLLRLCRRALRPMGVLRRTGVLRSMSTYQTHNARNDALHDGHHFLDKSIHDLLWLIRSRMTDVHSIISNPRANPPRHVVKREPPRPSPQRLIKSIRSRMISNQRVQHVAHQFVERESSVPRIVGPGGV